MEQALSDFEVARQRPLRRRSTGDIGNAIHALQAQTSQPLSIQHEKTEDGDVSVQDDAWVAELSDADRTATWHPWWLRTTVLASFIAVFISLGIGLGIVMWCSKQNNGIFTSRMKGAEYVSRFFPTASTYISVRKSTLRDLTTLVTHHKQSSRLWPLYGHGLSSKHVDTRPGTPCIIAHCPKSLTSTWITHQ